MATKNKIVGRIEEMISNDLKPAKTRVSVEIRTTQTYSEGSPLANISVGCSMEKKTYYYKKLFCP